MKNNGGYSRCISRVIFLILAMLCFGIAGLVYWDIAMSDSVSGNYSRILYYETLMEKDPNGKDALGMAITKLSPVEQAAIRTIFDQAACKWAVVNTVNSYNLGEVNQTAWAEFLTNGKMSEHIAEYYVEPEAVKRNREITRQQANQALAEIQHHITSDRYVIIALLVLGAIFLACFFKSNWHRKSG